MYWKPWKKPAMDPKNNNEYSVELGLARSRIEDLKTLLQECVDTGMFQRGTTISDLERRIKSALAV